MRQTAMVRERRRLVCACVCAGGLLAAGTSGCQSKTWTGVETAAAKAVMSPEDENKLGLQVKQQLEQQPNFRYLDDAAINSEVARVAAPILRLAKQQRPQLDWSIRVVDDPKTVNAFSTPGGYIYIDSGLLAAVDNEAQLAGVIAHEAGHVVGYHVARQMINQYGLQAISSIVLGQNPGLASQIASVLVQRGALLAHSRADEDEADAWGVELASKAGYDPRGLPQFLSKLVQREGDMPTVLVWLSDHPASSDRVARVERLIAERNLAGGRVGEREYAAIKQRVTRLSGAPPATF